MKQVSSVGYRQYGYYSGLKYKHSKKANLPRPSQAIHKEPMTLNSAAKELAGRRRSHHLHKTFNGELVTLLKRGWGRDFLNDFYRQITGDLSNTNLTAERLVHLIHQTVKNQKKVNLSHSYSCTLELNGLDLQGSDFSYSQLFRFLGGKNVDLQKANFKGSFISGEQISGSIGAVFGFANLSQAIFCEAQILHTHFNDRCNLENADFTNSVLRDVVFRKGCNLTGADFRRARLENVIFEDGIDIQSANFDDAVFHEDCKFPNDFDTSKMHLFRKRANFDGADLRGVQLSNAYGKDNLPIEIASLRNANLSGANLYGQVSSFSDLTGANMIGVYAPHFAVRESELAEADLSGTDLREARFTSSNFYGALLKGANLGHVTLDRSNLCGADLTGALFDPNVIGSECFFYDDSTRFPRAFWLKHFSPFHEGVKLVKIHSAYVNEEKSSETQRICLSDCNLEEARFDLSPKEELYGVFRRSILTNANFSGILIKDSDFGKAELGNANFVGTEFNNVNFSGAKLPSAAKNYFDLSNIKQIIDFFINASEVEGKFEAYRECLASIKEGELDNVVKMLVNNYLHGDGEHADIFETLEILYSQNIADGDSYRKKYPAIQSALKSLTAPEKSNNQEKLISWLASQLRHSDKAQRKSNLRGLEVVGLLLPEDREAYLSILCNLRPTDLQKIIVALSELKVVSLSDKEILTEHLSLSSPQMSDAIQKIIEELPNELAQVVTRNSLNRDQLNSLKDTFLLNVEDGFKDEQFVKGVNAQLMRLFTPNLDEPEAIEKLNGFIRQNSLLVTENHKKAILKKYLVEILFIQQSEIIHKAFEKLNFINGKKKDAAKKAILSLDKNEQMKTMTLIAYLYDSDQENPKIIEKIYPIIESLVVKPSEVTEEIKQAIEAELLKDFDQRFKATHRYSWIDFMASKHKGFKPQNINNFRVQIGEYTFSTLSPVDSIWNGEGVISYQCTSVPQKDNSHLQLGIVGTANMPWIQVLNSDNEVVEGFDLRILQNGSLMVGERYSYHSTDGLKSSGSYEQQLTDLYCKHVGISQIALPEDKVADPQIGNLDGVYSYPESGTIYSPSN